MSEQEQKDCGSSDDEAARELQCNWAHMKQKHYPHRWEPQPGMPGMQCPGVR